MGKKIKLIPARMQDLWNAMTREEQRLQAAANAVAKIAASLDMEVAAKANIDASLQNLQRQLKQQAANMQTMQKLAQMAVSEMDAQDAALANEAKGIVYNARQTAVAGAMLSNLNWNGTRGGLNLDAMANVDMLSNMTALLGPQPGIPLDTLNGVSLTSLLKQELGSNDTRMTDKFIASCMENPVYQLAGLGVVANSTRQGMDAITKSKTSSKSKKQTTPQAGIFQWGQKAVNKIGSKVSKGAQEVSKKAKEAKNWAEEKLDEGFETVKKFANSKGVQKFKESYEQHLEYGWQLTGDALAIGGDIFGFAVNCAKGDMLAATSDGYGMINDCFALYQDGEAQLQQYFGDVFAILGNDETAQEYYADAALSAERQGIADELYHAGFDEAGMVVEVVDGVNTAYKTITGFKSFFTNMEQIDTAIFETKDKEVAIELIFEQTGWKIPDAMEDSQAIEDYISRAKDVAGNFGLAYKYIDGLVDGTFFETFITNTAPGKPVDKVYDADDSFEEFWECVMNIEEKHSKK